MADILGEHETHNGGSSSNSPKSKADKRKQTIIAITGVVAVLLTYLLWRHSTQSSGSTAQNYSEPTGGTEADNGGGASSPNYSDAMNSIGSQLTTMQGQLQSQQSAYDSLEEEFNSKIGALTQTQARQGAQIHHQATVIHDTTQAQGAQIHHQAQVIQAHEKQTKSLAHVAAHKNTHQTKKKK